MPHYRHHPSLVPIFPSVAQSPPRPTLQVDVSVLHFLFSKKQKELKEISLLAGFFSSSPTDLLYLHNKVKPYIMNSEFTFQMKRKIVKKQLKDEKQCYDVKLRIKRETVVAFSQVHFFLIHHWVQEKSHLYPLLQTLKLFLNQEI